MKLQQNLIQALLGGLMFFIFKLILEGNTSAETLEREGCSALVFVLVYGIYLVVRERLGKRPNK